MADLELVADSGVFALTGGISGGTIRLEITESLRLVEGFSLDIDLLVSSGFGFGETTSEQFSVGVAVAEALKLNSTSSTVAVWTQLIYDQASLSAAIKTAQALSVNEGLTLAQTTSLALAITIAQTLFLRDASQPLIDFNLSVVEAFHLNTAFGAFLGVDISEPIGLAGSVDPLWRPGEGVAETVTLADEAAQSLTIRVTCKDTAEFHDSNILNFIFSSQISEDVEITAGYVSPSGGFTTWAINTRTTGVTEYRNFVFDSFAQVGRRSFGANADGLFELDGDDDAGEPILADLLSGFMQVGGSKFTAFKCAYLGLNSKSGNFVLKLITGDDQTYIYALTAKDMRTTRVNFGKGLRSRYFRFELQNIDGADFDLNSIEFLPLVSQRRI